MLGTICGVPSKRFLSAEELAEWVPLALNTIRKKTSRREIPFLKVGRKVIYDWILITEWLEGSTSAQADQGVRNQRADGSELP